MVNITSIWKLGNSTFQVIEFDEDVTLATEVASPIGEANYFLSQNIEQDELYLKIYSENLDDILKEVLSGNRLELIRYDGRLQLVEPLREEVSLEKYKTGSKEMELYLNSADPYKYDTTINSTFFTLTNNSYSQSILYSQSGFETPLNLELEFIASPNIVNSYADDHSTLSFLSTKQHVGQQNLTIYALREIPTAAWFRQNGLIKPSFDNLSGWVWEIINPGDLLDTRNPSSELTNSVYGSIFTSHQSFMYNAFRFSYPAYTNSSERYLEVFWKKCQFCNAADSCYSLNPSISVWHRNITAWEDLNIGNRAVYFTIDTANISEYLVDERLHFMISSGHTNRLIDYSKEYVFSTLSLEYLRFVEVIDSQYVSFLNMKNMTNIATWDLVTFNLNGLNNFDGNATITIHPAIEVNEYDLRFDPATVLGYSYVERGNWSGLQSVTIQPGGITKFAIRIDASIVPAYPYLYDGALCQIKVYNTSDATNSIAEYYRFPDGLTHLNFSNKYKSIASSVEYTTLPTDLKITTTSNSNKYMKFDTSIHGVNHYLNSSYYYDYEIINNNLSDSFSYKNALCSIPNASTLSINDGGKIVFSIQSLSPFSNHPQAQARFSGTFNAYINTSWTTTVSDWHSVNIYNTSFYNYLYNEDCDVIGLNHFFLMLYADGSSANISSLNIYAPIYDDIKLLNLDSNSTNYINFYGQNLSGLNITISYRNSYL